MSRSVRILTHRAFDHYFDMDYLFDFDGPLLDRTVHTV